MNKINLKIRLVVIGLTILSLGLWVMANTQAVVDEENPEEQEGRISGYQDIRLPAEPERPEQKPKIPEYALGELIVKLKEGRTLEDLQELNLKYNVTSTEKVFKDMPNPQDTLQNLKDKLTQLSTKHDTWYWQLEKDSKEYKDYIAKIEKEKQDLQKQISAQEELIQHLEERQKRAPEGVAPPELANIYLLKTDLETNVFSASQDYSNNLAVEYAEPNYIYHAPNCKIKIVEEAKHTQVVPLSSYGANATNPNDTYFGSYQWALNNTGKLNGITVGTADADIDGPEAWDIQRGSNQIRIAVIDTGVAYDHPDLSANCISGYDFVNLASNEFNSGSYKRISGEDYTNEDSDPKDFSGHGTHVSGIIAAKGNNGQGVSGVTWSCKIMPVRAGFAIEHNGDETGLFKTDDIVQALDYARQQGADIINMSFGGTGQSSAMNDAIQSAYAAGIVLVAATGNNHSSTANYPAAYEHVVAVSATDINDKLTNYSNYGSYVDVSAPGGDDISNPPAGVNYWWGWIMSTFYDHSQLGNCYAWMAGTSMASPHVSGLAGLILSQNSSLNSAQVENIIKSSADDKGASGRDNYYGYGRINAYKALTSLGGDVPAKPSNLTATTVSSTQISLSWQDNSNNETGFKIERSLSVNSGFSRIATTNANTTNYKDTGLNPATIYYYRVRATNNAGESSYSNIASATTKGASSNRQPVAIIIPPFSSGPSPLRVQFYGDRSYDLDGKIVSYRWNFGDGSISIEKNPKHTFYCNNKKGRSYIITLTVRDNQGASSTAQANVQVYLR